MNNNTVEFTYSLDMNFEDNCWMTVAVRNQNNETILSNIGDKSHPEKLWSGTSCVILSKRKLIVYAWNFESSGSSDVSLIYLHKNYTGISSN